MTENNPVQLKTKILNQIRKTIFIGTPFEHILRKIVSGATAGDWRSKLLPNHYQYPNPTFRTVERAGQKFTFNLSDWMEWAAYFELVDPAALQYVKWVKKNDAVLDIGANIGSIVEIFGDAVGPKGQVFGFEPDPGRFEKCQARIAFLGLTNAQVINIALGAREENVHLASPDAKNLGRTRITRDGAGAAAKCLQLDQWANEKQIGKVDLIKIDVEGYELHVLKGAENTLRKLQPKIIFEFDPANLKEQGTGSHDIFQFLGGLGYSFYRLDGSPFLIPSQFPKNFHLDILASVNTPT